MSNLQLEILRKILYPVGWLYAVVMAVRNHLFDSGVIKSRTFRTAVIAVGNITIGGTGKTPFVEYVIGILKDSYNIVELSRGYKRQSKGLQIADSNASAAVIGDESFQIHRKFPDIKVVVDADRCHAIDYIEKNYPESDVIILDDAYQHRYVSPGRSILLVDYTRPLSGDAVIPYGNLRESAKERYRADIVVMTKCPANMHAMAARECKNDLNLHAYQTLYFTYLKYSEPRNILDSSKRRPIEGMDVVLMTAIANPVLLIEHVEESKCNSVKKMIFEDHHSYSGLDINNLTAAFDSIEGDNKMILVTAKDEAKLLGMNLPETIQDYIYVIDINIEFLFNGKSDFDSKILSYVEKNKRNSVLFTK